MHRCMKVGFFVCLAASVPVAGTGVFRWNTSSGVAFIALAFALTAVGMALLLGCRLAEQAEILLLQHRLLDNITAELRSQKREKQPAPTEPESLVADAAPS